jgi:PAS domain S-box-containing protein
MLSCEGAKTAVLEKPDQLQPIKRAVPAAPPCHPHAAGQQRRPGHRVPRVVLLCGVEHVRIGLKIFLCLLGIAALVGVVGWRSRGANNAVRSQLEHLRRSSIQELVGAGDMLIALKETELAARELVSASWNERSAHRGSQSGQRKSAGASKAIEVGLSSFEEQLAASRRATEGALAMAEQVGDAEASARERYDISAWLDKIDEEIAAHRTLLGQLQEFARSAPDAAERYLDQRVEQHYVDVLLPLIQGYQEAAERELRDAVTVVESALAKADRDNTLLTLFALGVAVLLGFLTTRSIARPIAGLCDAADRLGAGDLTVRLAEPSSDELGALAASFNDMAERLQMTTVSKSYMDDLIRSMGEMLIATDPAGRVKTVNRATIEQLGWSETELIGRDVGELIRGPGNGASGPGEAEVVTRSGATLPVVCTPRDLHDSAGHQQGRVWVAQDIRHRKHVEEELRRSLAEKEALLREVHHRVKNNLQVISSLLCLQAEDDSTSPEAARLFHESENRIRSMALIHEQLYRSGDLARIDFRDYVDGLTRNVLASAGEVDRPIRLTLDVEPVSLDLDIAIACGLVLNELLSNALKHAFPDGESGTITVAFRCADGSATLVVADDGIGLPALPNSQERPGSLGQQLVRALVEQLGGVSSVEGDAGTRFTLTFPVAHGPHAAVARS